MSSSTARWIALGALALGLGACGSKGDLVLPEQPAKAKPAPAKDAAAKPDTARPEPH